jgi:DNA-binding cell septation regulator SpoVG
MATKKLSLKVTDVKISIVDVKKVPALKGYATIILNDAFAVKSIAIYAVKEPTEDKKYSIGFPQGKPFTNAEGAEIKPNIANPITAECRTMIEDAIFAAYEARIAELANPVAEPEKKSKKSAK